jgi:hypothetical protein
LHPELVDQGIPPGPVVGKKTLIGLGCEQVGYFFAYEFTQDEVEMAQFIVFSGTELSAAVAAGRGNALPIFMVADRTLEHGLTLPQRTSCATDTFEKLFHPVTLAYHHIAEVVEG